MRFTGTCMELKEIILSEIIQIQQLAFVLHKVFMMTLTLVYFIFSCIISTWLVSFSGSFLQGIRVKNTLSNGISNEHQKSLIFSMNIPWFLTIRKLYLTIYAVIFKTMIFEWEILYIHSSLSSSFISHGIPLYTRTIKVEMHL